MKKMILLGFTALLLSVAVLHQQSFIAVVPQSVHAASIVLTQAEESNVVSWITAQQYKNTQLSSYGAITVSDGIAVYETGSSRPLKRVVPYFSHLAVLGMMDTTTTGRLAFAKRWIGWYLSHIDPVAGVPLDTWYTTDGTYATTCPVPGDTAQCNTVDAEDSSAALLLVIADRYYNEGGSRTYIRQNKAAIRNVIATLTALEDTNDGMTWAKQTYPIKYFMDNVEVLAGLRAAAHLESAAFRDTARAKALTAQANRLQASLYGSGGMLSAQTGTYGWYKDGAGVIATSTLATWYPELMAQLWPYIFKQTTNLSAYTAALTAITNQVPSSALDAGDCTTLTAATGGVHAPVLAYALRIQGHPGGSLLTTCMYQALSPSFVWPATVADAGWLLRR